MLSPINLFKNPYIPQIHFKRTVQNVPASRKAEFDTFQRQQEQYTDKPPVNPLYTDGRLKNENGEIFNRRKTYMFRNDISSWAELGNYFEKRFDKFDKVNVYCYACSTGEEPYSLSILLLSKFKSMAGKFFPIIAKDINKGLIEENIEKQQNGNIAVNNGYTKGRKSLKIRASEMQQYIQRKGRYKEYEILSNDVIKPVKFSYGNILDDINNIDKNNPSIVMCRNMWPYVDPEQYDKFAQNLYQKLQKGSVVIIGDYDCDGQKGVSKSGNFPKSLFNAGFTIARHPVNNGYKLVFEKN